MVANMPTHGEGKDFWEPVALLTTQIDDASVIAFSKEVGALHLLKSYPGGTQVVVQWTLDAAALTAYYAADTLARGTYLASEAAKIQAGCWQKRGFRRCQRKHSSSVTSTKSLKESCMRRFVVPFVLLVLLLAAITLYQRTLTQTAHDCYSRSLGFTVTNAAQNIIDAQGLSIADMQTEMLNSLNRYQQMTGRCPAVHARRLALRCRDTPD